MKAIIETGGKQYYVSEGTVIYVEKLDGNEGDKVVFDKVLMANGVVGNPYVSSKVEGVILKQGKQKKLTIFRYKPNKRSTRVKKGHRQPYTKIQIEKITTTADKAKKEDKAEKKEVEKKEVKKTTAKKTTTAAKKTTTKKEETK